MIRRNSHCLVSVGSTSACVAAFLAFSVVPARGQQLTWTGGATAAWNNTDANWNPSGSFYSDGSGVLFPSGGTNTSITIQSGGVLPQTVTFTNGASTPYSFTGGAIGDYSSSQPTTVTLAGAGSVTFRNSNTYSGGTTISAGTLVSASQNSLGTGTITLSGGELQLSGQGNNLGTSSWVGTGTPGTAAGAASLIYGLLPATIVNPNAGEESCDATGMVLTDGVVPSTFNVATTYSMGNNGSLTYTLPASAKATIFRMLMSSANGETPVDRQLPLPISRTQRSAHPRLSFPSPGQTRITRAAPKTRLATRLPAA